MTDQEYIEAHAQRLAELEAALDEAEASLDVESRLKAAGLDFGEVQKAIARMAQTASPEAREQAKRLQAEQDEQEKAARAQALSAMSKTATSGTAPVRRPRNMA